MSDELKKGLLEQIKDIEKYKKLGIMPINPGKERFSKPVGGGCSTCGGYLWVVAGSSPQPGVVGICDGCMAKAADMYKAAKKLNFLE